MIVCIPKPASFASNTPSASFIIPGPTNELV